MVSCSLPLQLLALNVADLLQSSPIHFLPTVEVASDLTNCLLIEKVNISIHLKIQLQNHGLNKNSNLVILKSPFLNNPH